MKKQIWFPALILFSSTAWADTFVPYKELSRTYTRLETIDLAGCRSSYRFLNGNWMDCTTALPSPGFDSPVQQIFPADFPIETLELDTPVAGVRVRLDIRTTATDYDEAA